MPHLSISGPLEGQLELPSLISDILLFYWDKRRRTRFNFFRFLLLNFFHKVCVELGNKVYNRAIVSPLRNLAEKEQVYLVCTFCSPFANNLTLFFLLGSCICHVSPHCMSLIVDADVDKKLKAFSPFEVVSSLDDFEGEKGLSPVSRANSHHFGYRLVLPWRLKREARTNGKEGIYTLMYQPSATDLFCTPPLLA